MAAAEPAAPILAAPSAAATRLTATTFGIEQKSDELLDPFTVGVALAGNAVVFGRPAEHQPPAREDVLVVVIGLISHYLTDSASASPSRKHVDIQKLQPFITSATCLSMRAMVAAAPTDVRSSVRDCSSDRP